jgi:hypothetical protein
VTWYPMRMDTEVWRDAVGYEGRYEVSDRGRVRSLLGKAPLILRPGTDSSGHKFVSLRKDGKSHSIAVHKLVLTAFVGPRPEGLVTRHLDGVHENNALTNLCYGTQSENQYDRVRLGTHASSNRTHCPQGHAYSEENTYVNRVGARNCRTCSRERALRYYYRKKAQGG